MNITDSPASYRSDKDIETTVSDFRADIDYNGGLVDILKIYEYQLPKYVSKMKNKEFIFRIVNDEDTDINLSGLEALTIVDEESITVCIPEDTYERARHGNGRCRFTFAHELAHVILHSDDKVVLARYTNSTFEAKSCDPAYNAEVQANKFAAELLAPAEQIRNMRTREIEYEFKVSRTVAEIQRRKATRLHK